MNNGQTGQSLANGGIFSPESVNAQANQSIAAVEDVLNSQGSWAPERDNRGIGNKAILSNETPATNENIDTPGATSNLGEIVDLDPPMAPTPQPNTQPESSAATPLTIDENLIRPDGDHISGATINEINRAENELSQTGDINKFSDEIYEMKKKYLKNAFGREIAS